MLRWADSGFSRFPTYWLVCYDMGLAVLIAEHFVLLALDRTSGRIAPAHRDTRTDIVCAAGLLIDLLVQRRLVVCAPDRFQVDASLPSSHTLLNAAAAALATKPDACTASALRQIARRLAPLTEDLLEGLYRRDFLHRVRDRRFWRSDVLRYPLRSLQARNDASALLQQACDGAGGTAGLGLLVLADVAGIMTTHLDARQHERANQLLLSLNDVAFDEKFGGIALIRDALLA